MVRRPYGTSDLLPDARRYRGLPTPLYAFCTILAFCALLAVSGPHLVHHLLDSSPPADHHSHADDTQQPPDCLVLALLQHSPVTAERVGLLPRLLQAPELPVVTSSLRQLQEPIDVAQARAPPGASIHHT